MRWWGRALVAACLALPGAARAQAPAPPPDPTVVAAARAAADDSVRGAALRVVLLTVGQGDLIFERYGHNLLWISDTTTGAGTVWEWGLFDFDQPQFVSRFLFGNTSYSMGRWDAASVLTRYRRDNREVIAQELALTPGQRAALDAFVRTNYLEAHRHYRYDYFLDNCSTRLRDALDVVLDGALSGTMRGDTTAHTHRSETLRLNQHNPWLFLGLDLALGRPADHAMTEWEAAFVPMRLRDVLRRISVRDATGAMVPLVKHESILVRVERDAEPATIATGRIRAVVLLGALAIALLIVGLGTRRAPAARGAGALVAAAVHIVLGLLATLVLFMWFFTQHAFWAWNPHLLLFTPLSFVAAVSLARSRGRRPLSRFVEVYHLAVAALAFVVVAVVLVRSVGGSSASRDLLMMWAGASWVFHVAVSVAALAWRRRADGGAGGPTPEAAASMRVAA